MIQHRYLVLFVALCILAVIPSVMRTARYVEQGSPGSSSNYTSIQAAINAAASGDTIIVGPGLYNERIIISKSITVSGATAGVSKKGYTVPAGYLYDSTTESIIAPQDTQNAPVVTIEKGDVTFEGFIVSMTVAGSYPDYAPTELVRMTAAGNLNNVQIRNNVIGPNTNLTVQNGNAGRMGITVSKWSPGTGDNTVYDLQIRDNKIFDAKGDGCGILMIGAKISPPHRSRTSLDEPSLTTTRSRATTARVSTSPRAYREALLRQTISGSRITPSATMAETARWTVTISSGATGSSFSG